MLAYRPDRFARLFAEAEAQSLWRWLQQPEAVLVMETACHLRRPPLEALAHRLQDSFPRLMRRHAGRQMAGHMVRQILEARGFHLDRPNLRINRPGSLFRRGSSYAAA